MVEWNRDAWSNWVGDVVVDRPERRYYPTGLDDLVTIVGDAEHSNPPQRVRACGSHWAFSDVAVSPDWFVETNRLRRTCYGVIPAALDDRSRQALTGQASDAPGLYSYYHVEAGITIRDLNLRLDRQQLPAADRDWARMPTDGLAGSWPAASRRWALPTMGGAGGQTLAGAISTATHGGDHGLPPLADAVQAIHLVATGGRQLWIERDQGITDPARLRQVLPAVEPHYSTELFNAVLVSVGRMGILYALVIKVVNQFWLEQEITASTWEEELAGLRHPFTAFARPRPGRAGPDPEPTRFVEAVVVPYPRRDGRHNSYMTWRWRTPSECRPPKRKHPDLFEVLCSHRAVWPIILPLLVVLVLAIGLSLLIPVLGPLLVALELGALVLLAGLLTIGHLSVGDLLARACNLANRIGRSWVVRLLLERVLRQFRPRGRTCDVGYEIMDLRRTGGECYRGDSLEVAFDARGDTHVEFMRTDLFPTFERVAAAGRTVGGYVSLRFTRRSEAMLAMQRWDTTCSIEIALLKGIEGNNEIFQALEAAAVRRGGTVHWGQRNTLGRQEVAALYPELPGWRAQLAWLSSQGVQDTFDNAFCQQRGLEPAHPAAAGSDV